MVADWLNQNSLDIFVESGTDSYSPVYNYRPDSMTLENEETILNEISVVGYDEDREIVPEITGNGITINYPTLLEGYYIINFIYKNKKVSEFFVSITNS